MKARIAGSRTPQREPHSPFDAGDEPSRDTWTNGGHLPCLPDQKGGRGDRCQTCLMRLSPLPLLRKGMVGGKDVPSIERSEWNKHADRRGRSPTSAKPRRAANGCPLVLRLRGATLQGSLAGASGCGPDAAGETGVRAGGPAGLGGPRVPGQGITWSQIRGQLKFWSRRAT